MGTLQIISLADAKAAGYKRYFTGVPCLHGHTVERSVSSGGCLECGRIRALAARAGQPDKHRARERLRHEKNRGARNDQQRSRRAADADSYRQRDREYYSANAEKLRTQKRENRANRADQIRARRRERNATEPLFAFHHRVRSLIRNALVAKGFRKLRRTEDLLGCSIAEFRTQIERQFLPGMSWSNMSEWDIDHIVPAASARTQSEAEALSRAGNLRPMWRKENQSKGAAALFLL